VYVCPPGVHMSTEHSVRLIQGPRLRFVRPSADLMFESMARCYGDKSIGVVLSGAGSDGALGSLAISRVGGGIIAQQPDSCDFDGMPSAVLKIGATTMKLPPEQIAAALQKLVQPTSEAMRADEQCATEFDLVTRVMLADDHQIMLNGLRLLLDGEPDLSVVGQVEDGETALRCIAELKPDVVVMDICMPQLDGIEATREIVSRMPSTKVVALSSRSDADTVNRTLEAGATGYLTKHRAFGELAQAIRCVEQDQEYFSADIARLVDPKRTRVTPTSIAETDIMNEIHRAQQETSHDSKTD
jgi:chemotaxis response regulator CheB